MKRILLLSLLLLPIVALAQYPTFSNKQKLGVQTTGDGLIFRGNGNPNYNPSNINNAYFYLDTTTSKLYLYNDITWQQIYPTASDTLSLGAYLLKSDTSAMLLPYLRKSDTISLSNRINLKLNISDTTILSNRITTNANNIITINNKLATKLDTIYTKFKDVVTMIENKDTINIGSSLTDGYGINIIGDSVNIDTSIIFTQSDTITLSNRIDTKLNVSDTVSLSNRIDLKLNKTDTINLSDRIDLKLNKSDTISLSNRIDIKLNASDTVSLSNRINKKLDTLYVNYPTYIDTITNKDTIQIAPSLVLTEGFGINIIGDSINIDSAVILETQQKQIAYVKNQSGVTMYKGQAVYSSGSSGSNKLVQLASSNTEQASSKTFGIVETDSIPNGGHGYVITFGVLSGFNTNALTEGFTVYLSSTPGQLTSVKPIAPLNLVTIGMCIRQQQNNGSIFVKIQNGFEFDELHDVRITTPVDKASIYYNLSENLWRDTTATLLVSDTISMLNPYLRKLDTISLSNRIDLRVKYADTTNMLLPYFRTNDTTLLNLNSRLSIKLNLSDTANMLSKYVNTYSNQIDINGNKTFNNVVTIDSATVTGKLLVNTNISDAVKINSNTNSTNLELMNNNGTVSIKSTNRNMVLQTDTTALIYLNGETNRVGILTMTPEQALEVNGTIRVDSLSNNLTPVKIIGANSSNDLTNLEIGNGLFISNDTLRVADNIINSGDTATLLRQDFLGINTNVLTWQQGSKKLLQYFTQVYRNGQLLKSDSQYTITSDSIVTLEEGSYRLGDNITIIAIDNIVALAGSGSMITLQGDVTGSGTNTITTTIGVGKVTNSMLAGSISDSKLNTITTVGKVSNSATTATNNSTGNTIVSRDASGNFSAGTITASLNGNANTSTTLATGRTIGITGDLTYTSPSFNGSTNVTAVGTLANSGVAANTYTAATVTVDAKGRITSASSNTIPTVNDGTLTMAVSGNGLTGSQTFTANQSTAATFTVTSNATNSNTPSTIVYRDASGNFSAGSITASNFFGNATSSTNSTNTTNVLNYLNSNEIFKFKTTNATNVLGQRIVTTPGTDFSVARIDAAQTFDGTQTFNSTIIGSISGNAATVTTNANLTGDVTSTGNATSIATGVIVNADINASAAIAVSKLAASTISGVTLGNNLNTLTISSPLTGTSYNGSSAVSIGIPAATGSVNGYLSSTDWTTFNNKQSQLNGTGFVKASGTSITYDNSSYLPLTGGTLTGGLTGTTATFNTRLGVGSIENPSVTSLFTSGSGNQEIHFTHSDNIPGRKVSLRLTNNNSGFYTYGGLIYALQGEGLNQYTRMTLGVNTNEIMHLTRFSRVGILNDAPSYTLDVNGTFNATGNSLIGGTLGVTGATNISNTLSTTSYAALDAGNNTHRLTNTLSGNQTWTPSAGFLTSYFNNNVSGGWYYNTSVDNSGFPILSILSTSNDRKKAGITLNSQGTANGTYSPAITFSSLSNSTSYYSAYAAIIGKKTGVGGASGSDANWNTGHIEFYGTTQATDVNGGVMLNSPSMTLGVGVGIGYDAPPTIKGRLTVLEKLGINQSTPAFTLDVSGTANITSATTLGSTLSVTGATTLNNILTINSGANTNSLSINNTGASNILSMYSTNNSSFTRSEYKNGLTGSSTSDGLNVGYFDGGYFVNYENTKSYLYTNNNVNQLVLDTDGNVGVGIADATDKLDVNGTLRVRTTNTIVPTSILGRDNNGVVGGVSLGNSLNLSSGTLNVSSKITDINTSQYTILSTDLYIDNFNNSSTTIILPLAGLNTYRELKFKNSSNGALIANGNIIPLSGSGTTTTILPATNAKWCTLVSDGAFWRIMQSN